MKPFLSKLELKIPPVLLLWFCLSGAYGLAWLFPAAQIVQTPSTHWLHMMLCSLIAFMGPAFIAAGVIAFKRHQTTVNPWQPETSAHLVQTGIYRRTRNPMYVGFGLILLAWLVYLAHAFAILWLPFFIAYLTYFQILPEERFLNIKFQDAFQQYCQRVRRWL